MRDGKRQCGITLPTRAWEYIARLQRSGLYGDSESAVVRSLVMGALQDAIAKGIIDATFRERAP